MGLVMKLDQLVLETATVQEEYRCFQSKVVSLLASLQITTAAIAALDNNKKVPPARHMKSGVKS